MKRRRFLGLLPACLFAHPVLAQATEPGVAVIFVAASWCPYCAQVAPLLASLPREAGVPILVASLDNQPVLPFRDFVDGQSHPLSARAARIPVVMVFNQRHADVTHVIDHYRNPRQFVQLLGAALRQSVEM